MYLPSPHTEHRRFSPLGADWLTWVGAIIFLLAVAQIIAMGVYHKDLIGGLFNIGFNATATDIMFAFILAGIIGYVLITGRGARFILLVAFIWFLIHVYGSAWQSKSQSSIFKINELPDIAAWNNANRSVQAASVTPRAAATTPAQRTPQHYYNVARKMGLVRHQPLTTKQLEWCKTNKDSTPTAQLNCYTRWTWRKG